MSKHRISLKSLRKNAHRAQGGRCYYCALPIWEEGSSRFASAHQLSLKQARLLKSTGEHLKAHAESGKANRSNIAAACTYCNSHRHRMKQPLRPERYKRYVHRKMAKGGWHQLHLKGCFNEIELEEGTVK